MLVYMLKDVENVGMAGTVKKVSDGYARNILIPKKIARQIFEKEKPFFESRVAKIKVSGEVITSKAGMLAERISNMHVTVKKRVHDDGKLYGAVGADEIVDLLKAKDVSINKKQVELAKGIKSVGEHKAVIRLSAKLRPELTVKVVSI
jgi:large subunit ribosomal protein L9